MVDARFFPQTGPTPLRRLAEISASSLKDDGDGDRQVETVAALADADETALSFLDNRKYAPQLAETRAGAVMVHPRFSDAAPDGCAVLINQDPYRAYALCAQYLHPDPTPWRGAHAGAIVDPAATIDPSAEIAAGAVIGAGAEIAAGCIIGPNAVVGAGVVIGENTRLGPNASVEAALIGARCLLHPGVRIGSRGFGFAMGSQGHLSVPQLGRVIIGDDVEVGANSTIDRGAGPDTVIGDGCRIDNLVQIGHNVRLGRGVVMVAQSGIAGSTVIGDFAAIGGQAAVAGHLTIGAGARLAAQCGVMRDVAPGESVGGSPAVAFRDWMRQTVYLKAAVSKGNKS